MLENGKRLTVTEIYTRLKADQSAVSHHLSILRDKGILGTERKGKFIYYYLKNTAFLSLIDCLNQIQQAKAA
jgi:DNA-binding transcriptional ArsR family regulator